MNHRVDIKAILADPEQRKEMIIGSIATLIRVGEDFNIESDEALRRAVVAYNSTHRLGPNGTV